VPTVIKGSEGEKEVQMRRLHRRQALAYALGVLTAGGGFAVGAAWAGHAAAGDNTIHACAQKGTGGLYQQTAAGACRPGDQTVEWSITGPQGSQGIQGVQGIQGIQGLKGDQGAPGKNILTALSPNGLFSITVSNSGILIGGPNATFTVDFAGARMNTIGGASP
jgi:hypothetical protein